MLRGRLFYRLHIHRALVTGEGFARFAADKAPDPYLSEVLMGKFKRVPGFGAGEGAIKRVRDGHDLLALFPQLDRVDPGAAAGKV